MVCDSLGDMNIFAGEDLRGEIYGEFLSNVKTEATEQSSRTRAPPANENTATENGSGEAKFSKVSGERYALTSDSDIEAENIKSGNEAVGKMIEEAKTAEDPENIIVKNVLYRTDLGYIDFKWGTPGRGEKYKGGYGLSHIIAKRNAENGNGEEAAYKMVQIIAKATEAQNQSNDFAPPESERIKLFHDDGTAVLTRSPNDNRWLLTGWDNKKEANAFADGEVRDSSTATAANPTQTRIGGVDAFASNDSISSSGEKVKQNFSREVDADYMAAVDSGDMEAAQRMVDEAAAAAMPNTKIVDENGYPMRVYHGSESEFTVFDRTKGRANMDMVILELTQDVESSIELSLCNYE